MPSFLDVVGVSSFRVIVVEQTQRGHWNKGILFNRGVVYAESIACDYVVMNDVDQVTCLATSPCFIAPCLIYAAVGTAGATTIWCCTTWW